MLELALADVADPTSLLRAIEGRLPGTVTTEASGDAASLLDRDPATYRVNVGVDRPVYAPLHWLCVVDPGDHTRAELATLLERAHAVARRKHDDQRSRTAGGSAV